MLALAVVYFVTARLGLTQATFANAASPVWPATGVALAGLYLLGISRWPGVFVAACAVFLASGSMPPVAALALGVGNTLEAVLGALLLRRLDFSPTLSRPQDVLALTTAAATCTLARVLTGALGLLLTGKASWEGLGPMAWEGGLGNALGALVVGSVTIVAFTGLVLAVARAGRDKASSQWEASSQLELLATAVRSVREGVLISEVRPGEGPRLVFANESFRDMVGRSQEELVGRAPQELCGGGMEPEVYQRLGVALRENGFFRGEVVLAHKDGSRVYSEMQLSPVRNAEGQMAYFVATHRDITAQKQLQAKLVSAERIAAVGTLAAGVGHEINNPLAYLMLNLDGVAQCLARGPEGLAEAQVHLESAREGAERIRVIVRDLKVFSRQEGEDREMLDVNEVVVPALRMAAHAVRPRARLVEDFGNPPRVMGSEARLGQVMLNLLVNALQAIPEGDPEHHEVRVRTGRDDAGRALVEVSDTGCGMSPTVLARIFDPFFTTKPTEEGTGLGLAICQQIVRAHGGELRVRSEEGKGTRFTILLPSAEGRPAKTPPPVKTLPPARTPVPVAPTPAPVAPPRRRILIIDDEPRLAQSMRMLIEPSHDVSVTTRGAEALAWVSEGQRFDLVLCDLQMPGTTGMDVYSHLRAHAPELAERLVFISGGAYTQATRDFVRSVRNRILEKPVRPNELLATIDEALATTSAA
jgi:PAS domain S-box-containing protein